MKKKKIKLLYDSRILSYGANKTTNRTGIFFTTLNLLKQMLQKPELEVALYTTPEILKDLKTTLKMEFPNKRFKILVIRDLPVKSRVESFCYVYENDKNFLKRLAVRTIVFTPYYLRVFWLKLKCFIFSFNRFDAVFSPSMAIIDGIKDLHIKNYFVFLHDIIPLLYPNYFQLTGEYWYEKLLAKLNKNDTYFTNSECTKKDYIEHVPQVDPQKIHTVYLGCNIDYLPNAGDLDKVKTKYGIPKDKKYLFSLCSLEPRKNLIRMIETFVKFVEKNNIDDLIMVMGGGSWKSFQDKLNKALKNANTDKILKIGYVDDEDLKVLYSGAEWFTYTSQYEGFGLPVLEAMYCGCPVITSNNSSLPEVIGDAGIKIDWDSDEQHIQAYEQYYYNENLRKENSRKGREQAKKFSWEKTANRVVDIMFETINKD